MLSLARRSTSVFRTIGARNLAIHNISPDILFENGIRCNYFLPSTIYAHDIGRRNFSDQSAFAKLIESNRKALDEISNESEVTAAVLSTIDSKQTDSTVDNNSYEQWHMIKQQELQNLSDETDQLLTTASLNNNEIDSILGLMIRWKEFTTQLTPEMYSMSPFRRKNHQYPPSEFMTSITFEAAAKCQSLLTHLLAGNNVPPTAQVQAYKLCMETWSQVHHSSCGDRAEDILEAYGERFGGDMDLAPTLDCYKVALQAYNRSCSSYFVQSSDEERIPSPGEKACEVLNLLSSVSAWDLYLKPDVELYSHAINAMRNTLLDWKGRTRDNVLEREKYEELATRALLAFKDMEICFDEMKHTTGELSVNEWNIIIRAYADVIAVVSRVSLQEHKDFDQTSDNLLCKLEDLVSNNSKSIASAAAIDGNSICMKNIRHHIEEAYKNAITSGMNLNKSRGHFNDLTAALDHVANSEKIFLQMKERHEVSSPFLFPEPTQDHYGALIKCVVECLHGGYSSSDTTVMSNLNELPHNKATRLLIELEKSHAKSFNDEPIDGSIYYKVVWGKCQVIFWKSIMQQEKFSEIADSVEDMIGQIEDKYNRGLLSFSSYSDVPKIYNSVFRFYSKRSRFTAMGPRLESRALDLLDQLERFHKSTGGKIKPDEVTFQLILKIFSDNGSFDAVETILSRMKAFGLEPNENHYHAAMRPQSRADPIRNNENDTHLNAQSILQQVKEKYAKDGSAKPTTRMYTSCISAIGGSSENNKVDKILKLSEELKDLYVRSGDDAFKPDAVFYGAILDALSKTNDPAALDNALRILDEIETNHSNGVIDAGPNRVMYTSVLHAIAKSSKSNGANIAEDLIHRMVKRSKDLKEDSLLPDKVAYGALLQVLATSEQRDSVDRAERWFKELETQYMNGDESAKPDKRTYTCLINCWAKSNRPESPDRVAKILKRMEAEYEDGNLESKPDAHVYGSFMKLLSYSKADDKAIRVWRLYQRMRSKYESGDIEMKPNNIIMTSIILACGHTNRNRTARANSLNVLVECLSEIKNKGYITPTPITFRTLLDAVKHIVPEDEKRQPLSSSIFQLCCREGQLDRSVLEALEKTQPDLYAKLPKAVQSGSNVDGIPSKWTRNVHKRRV